MIAQFGARCKNRADILGAPSKSSLRMDYSPAQRQCARAQTARLAHPQQERGLSSDRRRPILFTACGYRALQGPEICRNYVNPASWRLPPCAASGDIARPPCHFDRLPPVISTVGRNLSAGRRQDSSRSFGMTDRAHWLAGYQFCHFARPPLSFRPPPPCHFDRREKSFRREKARFLTFVRNDRSGAHVGSLPALSLRPPPPCHFDRREKSFRREKARFLTFVRNDRSGALIGSLPALSFRPPPPVISTVGRNLGSLTSVRDDSLCPGRHGEASPARRGSLAHRAC